MSAVHEDVARGVAQRRVLLAALVANGAFLVVEVVGGFLFDSLALLADAAHMASDVAALAVALGAQTLMDRPASARHSYGLRRAEVLGALANGALLLVASGWIVVEAIGRLGSSVAVDGRGLLLVAAVGLVVNLASAVAIARKAGGSLNMRAAFVHMAADAAGSLGAMTAGAAVLIWDVGWADPVVSILIAVLVLWSAWSLLRDTVHVLLEGTPRGMDAVEVRNALASEAEVEEVHHVHLWNIASDMPALSAHVVLGGEVTLHEAQLRGEKLKALLAERFGIEHATLELECHACEPENEVSRDRSRAP
jgi:cobalt-zinc-cadmium efflux system protein